MADLHLVVVDDVGEVVDREAVRLEQHGVPLAHVGRVERDLTVHHVLDAQNSISRHLRASEYLYRETDIAVLEEEMLRERTTLLAEAGHTITEQHK